MGVYDHILVPLEGGETDATVLEHVGRLAEACGADVTLLRVAHYHTRDQRACELEDAEGDLARAARQLRSHGITVCTEIASGEPREVIVQQAAKLRPDLIAMATHGHGWAKRMVLGSVADHVRHNTDVPLLLLRGAPGPETVWVSASYTGPAMADRLILFDIDCTLIDAHGAGGRAILRAIKDVYGVEGELGDYSFHGRTDPGIIGDLAELWGAGEPDASAVALAGETQPQVVHDLAERLGAPAGAIDRLVDACISRYLEVLREEIDGSEVVTLPGIRELVTALAADRRALVGLLTGNVEEGARLKLEPTGLLPLFKVGAYGSDSALRVDLPAVAVARAEALTGRRYAGKDIVVIGDTPADVQCGYSLGVTAVAVATGRHSVKELARHAPDHLYADFSDWRSVYDAIMS